MASRKSINTCILKYLWRSELHNKYFSSLWVRGTSLLTCSYIGEVRNGREFKCENKPFIVFILILRRVLF